MVINEHARELIEEYDVRTTNEIVPAASLYQVGINKKQSLHEKLIEILIC